MQRIRLSGSKLRWMEHDASARLLTLGLSDGTVWVYQEVQNEVATRLRQAPNPDTFWEDRIADEYVHRRGTDRQKPQGDDNPLDALFR